MSLPPWGRAPGTRSPASSIGTFFTGSNGSRELPPFLNSCSSDDSHSASPQSSKVDCDSSSDSDELRHLDYPFVQPAAIRPARETSLSFFRLLNLSVPDEFNWNEQALAEQSALVVPPPLIAESDTEGSSDQSNSSERGRGLTQRSGSLSVLPSFGNQSSPHQGSAPRKSLFPGNRSFVNSKPAPVPQVPSPVASPSESSSETSEEDVRSVPHPVRSSTVRGNAPSRTSSSVGKPLPPPRFLEARTFLNPVPPVPPSPIGKSIPRSKTTVSSSGSISFPPRHNSADSLPTTLEEIPPPTFPTSVFPPYPRSPIPKLSKFVNAFAALRQFVSAAKNRSTRPSGKPKSKLNWQQRQKQLQASVTSNPASSDTISPRYKAFLPSNNSETFALDRQPIPPTDLLLATRSAQFPNFIGPKRSISPIIDASVRAKLSHSEVPASTPFTEFEEKVIQVTNELRNGHQRMTIATDADPSYGKSHQIRDNSFILNFARRAAYISTLQESLLQLPVNTTPPLEGSLALYSPKLFPGPPPEASFDDRRTTLFEVRAKRGPMFITPTIPNPESVLASLSNKLGIDSKPTPLIRPELADISPPLSNPYVFLAVSDTSERNGISGRPNRQFVTYYEQFTNQRIGINQIDEDFVILNLSEPRHFPGLKFSLEFEKSDIITSAPRNLSSHGLRTKFNSDRSSLSQLPRAPLGRLFSRAAPPLPFGPNRQSLATAAPLSFAPKQQSMGKPSEYLGDPDSKPSDGVSSHLV